MNLQKAFDKAPHDGLVSENENWWIKGNFDSMDKRWPRAESRK